MTARRVFQLDADQLQDELVDVFLRQCDGCFKFIFNDGIGRFKPELKAVLQFFLLQQSLLKRAETFPQSMLRLKYSYRGQWRAVAFVVLYVLISWYSDRADLVGGVLARWSGVRATALARLSASLETLLKVLSLCNFVLFLAGGRYVTVLQRLLGMSMVPSGGAGLVQPTSEYTDREEAWHGFTEFVMCVLPFLNLTAVKNWVKHTLVSLAPRLRSALVGTQVGTTLCAVCKDTPTLPHVASCDHVFCYYCISANKMADSNFKCPVCHSVVMGFQFAALAQAD